MYGCACVDVYVRMHVCVWKRVRAPGFDVDGKHVLVTGLSVCTDACMVVHVWMCGCACACAMVVLYLALMASTLLMLMSLVCTSVRMLLCMYMEIHVSERF